MGPDHLKDNWERAKLLVSDNCEESYLQAKASSIRVTLAK